MVEVFEALKAMSDTHEEKVLFTLSLIMGAMVLDFLTGTIAAKINPDITFKSKAGIDGILRKLASIVLLTYCIPLSVVLPDGVGPMTLQVLYWGYLFFELLSIVENAKKMGLNTEPLEVFISHFLPKRGKRDDEPR